MEKLPRPTMILGGITAGHVVSHLYFGGLPMLYPAMVAEFHLTYTQLGLFTAAASVIGGFMQLFFGILGRTYSRRFLLVFGNLLQGAGNLMIGYASSFVQLVIYRTISGVGSAPQHPLGTAMIADTFGSKLRGSAIGVHFGLSYVGNILGPIVTTAVLLMAGWRFSIIILSIPSFAMALSLLIMLKGIDSKPRLSKMDKTPFWHDFIVLRRNRTVIMIILAQSVLAGGTGHGALTTYIPMLLSQVAALDIATVGMVFTVMLVGAIAGPLTLGRFSDYWGRKRTVIMVILFMAVFLYLLTLGLTDVFAYGVTLFLLGFTSFSITSILQAFIADHATPGTWESYMGLYFTFGFGFGSMWTLIIGYLIDVTGSFNPAFYLMSILSLISALIMAFTPETAKPR